jgi:hypothetical protein
VILSVGANSLSSVTVPCEIAEPVMCKGTLLDRLTVEKVKERIKNALLAVQLTDLLLDFGYFVTSPPTEHGSIKWDGLSCISTQGPGPYVDQGIQSGSTLEVA